MRCGRTVDAATASNPGARRRAVEAAFLFDRIRTAGHQAVRIVPPRDRVRARSIFHRAAQPTKTEPPSADAPEAAARFLGGMSWIKPGLGPGVISGVRRAEQKANDTPRRTRHVAALSPTQGQEDSRPEKSVHRSAGLHPTPRRRNPAAAAPGCVNHESADAQARRCDASS